MLTKKQIISIILSLIIISAALIIILQINTVNIIKEFSSFNYNTQGYKVNNIFYVTFIEGKPQYPVVVYTTENSRKQITSIMRIYKRDGTNKFSIIMEREYNSNFINTSYDFSKESLSTGQEFIFAKDVYGSGGFLDYDCYGWQNGNISVIKRGDGLAGGLVGIYKDQLLESDTEGDSLRIYDYKDFKFQNAALKYQPDYKDKTVEIIFENNMFSANPNTIIMRLGERINFINKTGKKFRDFQQYFKPDELGAYRPSFMTDSKPYNYVEISTFVVNEKNKIHNDPEDFTIFLNNFISNLDFQKKRILFPLVSIGLSPGDSTKVRINEADWKPYNIRQYWQGVGKSDKVIESIKEANKKEKVFAIGGEGSSVSEEFYFILLEGKWMLNEIIFYAF